MTPQEFKAWFEGFCEGVSETPSPEQWAKVKAKVAEMGGFLARELNAKRLDVPASMWPDLVRTNPLPPPVMGTAAPMPDRGQVIAQNGRLTDLVHACVSGVGFNSRGERISLGHNARPISPERPMASGRFSPDVIPVSHETRVVCPTTGRDLGPSD